MSALSTEPLYYHSTKNYGFFAILKNTGNGKRQFMHQLRNLPDVLNSLENGTDTWISQSEFRAFNRQAVNFSQTSLAWVDLDYYNTAYKDTHPDKLSDQLGWFCRFHGYPEPSLIIYSGRGLQLKWVFTSPVPSRALQRWKALQDYLCKTFTDFGSDPKAIDVSRVLRVVGTVNSKSKEMCRIINESVGNAGNIKTYTLDELCDSYLPFSRDEVQLFKAMCKEKQDIRAQLSLQNGCEKLRRIRAFNIKTLNWSRLEDLRKLCRLRGWSENGVPEGFQDWFLFLATCFLSWTVNPEQLHAEVACIAKEFCPTWKQKDFEAVTSAAIKRTIDAAAGSKVTYKFRSVDPRYTFSNARLIETLEITDSEQMQLSTIISHFESCRRERVALKKKRRASGMMDRETYCLNAEQKRIEARLRHSKGENIKDIATAMGVSVESVKTYVYRRV